MSEGPIHHLLDSHSDEELAKKLTFSADKLGRFHKALSNNRISAEYPNVLQIVTEFAQLTGIPLLLALEEVGLQSVAQIREANDYFSRDLEGGNTLDPRATEDWDRLLKLAAEHRHRGEFAHVRRLCLKAYEVNQGWISRCGGKVPEPSLRQYVRTVDYITHYYKATADITELWRQVEPYLEEVSHVVEKARPRSDEALKVRTMWAEALRLSAYKSRAIAWSEPLWSARGVELPPEEKLYMIRCRLLCLAQSRDQGPLRKEFWSVWDFLRDFVEHAGRSLTPYERATAWEALYSALWYCHDLTSGDREAYMDIAEHAENECGWEEDAYSSRVRMARLRLFVCYDQDPSNLVHARKLYGDLKETAESYGRRAKQEVDVWVRQRGWALSN